MDSSLTKLLQPWDFPGKSTGVGCHFLLQGIFPTQESNPGPLHCRQILYRLSYSSATAKSLQSCPTLCNPIDSSPPGSPVPGILQARPDILECEVKWALGSISMNKASGGDGIPAELFQILNNDAVRVLHSVQYSSIQLLSCV